MKIPPPLKRGDRVIIIAPAGKIRREIVERGADLLRQSGFVVEVGSHIFDEEGMFAGKESDRISDMQRAIQDKNVKAIFFARGGYGSLRVQQQLNWSAFFKKPKWLIGFSDITVFHSYLANHGIASIHGVMPAFYEKNGEITDSFRKLMDLLNNPVMDYSIENHPVNRKGKTEGVLIGGNLSILYSLRGTPLDIDPKGKILFMEDLSEYYYHLDRMMMNLKAGGILKKISGLIVGQFTDMKDGETPYGKSAFEIISEAVKEYHYPVIFDFPAGHQLPNWPLIMGSRISMEVSDAKAVIRTVRK
jgi:muramoyltetrapeptide carboxypeptidase